MKNTKTLKMAQTAILLAVIIVMAFTPIGYLRTAGLEISLITIPVAIGAMVIGKKEGALLGLAFGLTSFYQCFGLSPFGATLLGINPLLTFLVCVPTRALMGYLTGWVFEKLYSIDKTKTVSYFIGGLLAAFFNTLFFMGTLMICFGQSEFMKSLNANGLNAISFVLWFVGVNGLLEMPMSCIASGIVGKTLEKAIKH